MKSFKSTLEHHHSAAHARLKEPQYYIEESPGRLIRAELRFCGLAFVFGFLTGSFVTSLWDLFPKTLTVIWSGFALLVLYALFIYRPKNDEGKRQ